MSVPHADADDYFWVPTSPPYVTKRSADERLRLMREVFLPRESWVLSGAVSGWGDALVPLFDAVVFLTLDPRERLARLRRREELRYGEDIGPGGVLESAHREFLTWARGYDDPEFDGRSLYRQRRWVATLPCPVLRLDASRSRADLAVATENWLAGLSTRGVRPPVTS
jgi:hypothetical protein